MTVLPEYKVFDIVDFIRDLVIQGVESLYDHQISQKDVTWNATRKEFEGDYTVVVFPFTRIARKKPEEIAEALGNYMVEQSNGGIDRFNVVKGFLNLVVNDKYWNTFLTDIAKLPNYGQLPSTGRKIIVEYSSPNTNKPLHLGHIRNILLGWSCSKILAKAGNEVVKAQIVNDRGIAICKSMLAWQKFGEGATPENSGIKGDFLVGKYYVQFETAFRAEYAEWQTTEEAQAMLKEKKKEEQTEAEFFATYKNAYFNEYSVIGNEAKDMLLKWEAGDEKVRQLWMMMNSWVYDGFEETYKLLGVDFDKLYYESDTYLLGKQWVEQGLKDAIFYTKEDGSVWIDLEKEKLDHKTVLRADGTSLYVTQDIGTAQLRYEDFKMDQMVYVVGNEQNYHFQTLFAILKKFNVPYADRLFHLSYGMVDLPSGKMKSREGTVVDADVLIKEVVEEAHKRVSDSTSEVLSLPEAEQQTIIHRIGLAALKYFIIKVNPKKRMTFNPAESVDLQGQTGPYIQYAFVRINGVLKKATQDGVTTDIASQYQQLQPQERELLRMAYEYPGIVQEAADDLDPSLIANYCYDMAKAFNKFWHDLSIFGAESPEAIAFRLQLAGVVGRILESGMDMLGIQMPEKM